MTTRQNSTREGVADAMAEWFTVFPVTTTDCLQEAIEKAFLTWMTQNRDDVLAALAAAVVKRSLYALDFNTEDLAAAVVVELAKNEQADQPPILQAVTRTVAGHITALEDEVVALHQAGHTRAAATAGVAAAELRRTLSQLFGPAWHAAASDQNEVTR